MGLGAGTFAPPAASRSEVEAILETLSRELDQIAATLADIVHDHLSPELEKDMRTWTVQAARSNLGVIVTMMREGADPESVQPPPEAIGYAKEYVIRGLDLSLMQRAYRTAQGVFAGIILERLRTATDNPDHLAEAMAFFNAWIFAWVEAIERQLTDVYMNEREQWVRGAAALRAAEVRALLAGTAADPNAVSLRLGYELDRFHVGYVVWSEEVGERPGDAGALFAAMERTATAIADSLGAGPPLTVAEGRHLACWAGRRERPDLAQLRLPAATDLGLSVAAGAPALGVEGFVLSHNEALLARRVAKLRGDGAGSCAAYPDLALEALLVEDPEAARRFAAHELGPLGARDDATVRLTSTLAIFLEEGASFVAAARRLGVHANTVAYRVRRAESFLGRPVGERQLELRVALRLARLLEN